MELVKTCTRCRRTLPLDRFSKNDTYKDGFKTICKDCVNDYGRHYYRHQLEKWHKFNENLTLKEMMQAEETLGGYKIFIQNHVKKGEQKYNIVDTAGEVFKTNNKDEFFNYLRGII